MPTRYRGSARAAALLSPHCIYVGHGSHYDTPFQTGQPSPSHPVTGNR